LPAHVTGRDVVQQVVTRIDALSDLMHELLLFARPPRPRSAPVDLESLLASTVDFLKNDPAFAHVHVNIEGAAPPITADPELLKIVFLNVMVNSGQAMNGQGRITVDLDATRQSCAISFLDSGPGIAAEARDKIFTPFFTTKRRGTGLGLATAKRLVEAHGGTIALVSPHGGGTRVTVQLPITATAAQIRTSSASASRQ
jgi:signal transduction histidine kinase